jgi:hypothetical protein
VPEGKGPKSSKKNRKFGRHKRKPGGGVAQARRTAVNKLKRINVERAKAGFPLLFMLPNTSKRALDKLVKKV